MFNRKTLLVGLLIVVGLSAILLIVAGEPLRVIASTARQQPTATAIPIASATPIELPSQGETASTVIQIQGIFKAPHQAALTFKTGGRLQDLRVAQGATVKKGDTLAALDTSELDLAVQQARAVLAGAQAHLSQVKTPATDADIALAQATLDAAYKNDGRVRAGPTANDLAALKAQVDNAQAAMAQAQAAFDKVGGNSNPNIGMLPQSLQLQTATNNYNAALAAYNSARTHPTAAELAAAWQQVQQAQDALARLQPSADSIAAAQAQVDQAQAALQVAELQAANATLTAPFDGTVILVGPHPGEMVGPSAPILTLADLSRLELESGIDQNLVSEISTGQQVTIVADAYKDRPITGKVSQIGWVATTIAGVTNIPITIVVDANDVPLRPGMTAAVMFDTGK